MLISARTSLNKDVAIFDLDSCLFDDRWRLDKINKDAPIIHEKYGEYHWNIPGDVYFIHTMLALKSHIEAGNHICIVTARPAYTIHATVDQFRACFGLEIDNNASFSLYFRSVREEGIPSPEYKAQALLDILGRAAAANRNGRGVSIVAYDDRMDVLKAYRETYHHIELYLANHDGIRHILAGDGSVTSMVSRNKGTSRDVADFNNHYLFDSACDIRTRSMSLHQRRCMDLLKHDIDHMLRSGIVIPFDPAWAKGDSTSYFRCKQTPIIMEETEVKDKKVLNAAAILTQAADTFRERNAMYKDNALVVGKVMTALFPNGVKLESPEDFHVWHLFELLIVKLTRYTNSGLRHEDSIHDLMVYAAMLEPLIETHKIVINGEKE